MTKQHLIDGILEPFPSDDPRFNYSLQIIFEDESRMEFQGAFYVLSRDKTTLQVFTEHCGYYGAPLNSIESIFIKPVKGIPLNLSDLTDTDQDELLKWITFGESFFAMKKDEKLASMSRGALGVVGCLADGMPNERIQREFNECSEDDRQEVLDWLRENDMNNSVEILEQGFRNTDRLAWVTELIEEVGGYSDLTFEDCNS